MKKFAIIDLETSGGNPKTDRITEICVHLFDGETIIDSFHTLVNPEVYIPYNITRITGITNDMVRDAPRFFEIAKRVVEITEGAIFVAHNVRFDYGFIQKEFRNLGYTYARPQLCTVRLSQKVLPGHASYALGNICRDLGIVNEKAHRAYGDAMATVKLFKVVLDTLDAQNRTEAELKEMLHEYIAEVKLPPHLPPNVFESLPDETGVYYMHNAKGQVIYVGKSTSIKNRIRSHFSEAHKNGKALRMVEDIHDISYELTGSELIALLLENEEIKRLLPKYNQAQRRNTFHFGIFSEPNEHGYLELSIRRLNDKDRPEASFTTRFAAEGALKRRIERHNLCMNLCGMSTGPGACFHHQIHQCKGACVQKENPDAYNARVEAAIETLNYGRSNFFIVGDGRNYEEKSVVKIENGVYTGYAYMYETEMRTPTAIASHIPYKPESPDVLNIIRNYIKKKPKEVKPWG